MIGMKNTLADLIDEVKPCGEVVPCGIAFQTLDKHAKLTIEEGLKVEPFCTEHWSYWVLQNMFEYFDEEVRMVFMSNIESEMMAFQIYIQKENLSEAEDLLLESKFKGKLPTAEKELEENVVVRAKNA